MPRMENGTRKTWTQDLDKNVAKYIKDHNVRIVRLANEKGVCGVHVVQRLLFQIDKATASAFSRANEGSLLSLLLGSMLDDEKSLTVNEVRSPEMTGIAEMVSQGIIGGQNLRELGTFAGQCPRMILHHVFKSFSKGFLKSYCLFSPEEMKWTDIKRSFERHQQTAIYMTESLSFLDHLEALSGIPCKVSAILKLETGTGYHGINAVHLPGSSRWLLFDNHNVDVKKTEELVKGSRLSSVADAAKTATIISIGFFPPPKHALPIMDPRPRIYREAKAKKEPETRPVAKEFKPCRECRACGWLRAREEMVSQGDGTDDDHHADSNEEETKEHDATCTVVRVALKMETVESFLVQGYNRGGNIVKIWNIKEKNATWKCTGRRCGSTDPLPSHPQNIALEELKTFLEKGHFINGCWHRKQAGRLPKKRHVK